MSGRGDTDPWERYGLVISAVWLVFLGFPLVAVLSADRAWWARVAGLALIGAFAAVYLHGFFRFGREGSFLGRHRSAASHLLLMALLLAAVWPVIGIESLGMSTFVVAFAMFTLPLVAAFAVGAAVVVVNVVAPVLLDRPDGWVLALIVLLVGLATGGLRVLIQRGMEHDEVAAEMALVSERERVARDVHDVLGHSLTVVTLKAELAARLVETDPGRAAEEMRQVGALSREALGEVRRTVGGLRVARLPDEVTAARAVLEAAGIRAEVTGDAGDVAPPDRPVLAWVLRELVTNVVRHSGAERCELRLDRTGLVVLDDGCGVTRCAEGNGLRGVRERLAAAGAELVLGTSEGGSGSRVEVRL